LDLRPHKVYFFELSIKFYIKSSTKTLKLTWKWKRNQKFIWELHDGIYFWGQKWKLRPVRPIPSVFQKEKFPTWKHLSKIGRTKFSFGQPHTKKSKTLKFVKNKIKGIKFYAIRIKFWTNMRKIHTFFLLFLKKN
jgi:hypothetical protein